MLLILFIKFWYETDLKSRQHIRTKSLKFYFDLFQFYLLKIKYKINKNASTLLLAPFKQITVINLYVLKKMVWLHHLSSLGQTLAISSVYDKTIKSWWKSKDGQFKTNLQINDQLKYEVCAICTFLSHSIQATENKTVNPSCFLFHSFNNLSLKCSIIWPIISLPNVFGKNHPYNTFMHILKILGKLIINKQGSN